MFDENPNLFTIIILAMSLFIFSLINGIILQSYLSFTRDSRSTKILRGTSHFHDGTFNIELKQSITMFS